MQTVCCGEMMKLTRENNEVIAVKFVGGLENINEMHKEFGDKFEYYNFECHGGNGDTLTLRHAKETANMGDWIVLSDNGLHVVRDKYMNVLYCAVHEMHFNY